MSSFIQRLAWLVLVLGAGVTWGVTLGLLNPVSPPDLTALPPALGAFRTLEVFAVDAGLLGDLPPDRFTYRQIGDDSGHAGQLYIAYFNRGRRWSGRPHDLPVCYRANGWEARGPRILKTESGARFEAQDFALTDRQIRVFYWIQQPGLTPGQDSPQAYLRRIFGPASLRQDMASVYLEFPLALAPSDRETIQAVEDIMEALNHLWSRQD